MQLITDTIDIENKAEKKIVYFLISFGWCSFLILTVIYSLVSLSLLRIPAIINIEGLFFFGFYLGVISLLLILKRIIKIKKIIFYSLISILTIDILYIIFYILKLKIPFFFNIKLISLIGFILLTLNIWISNNRLLNIINKIEDRIHFPENLKKIFIKLKNTVLSYPKIFIFLIILLHIFIKLLIQIKSIGVGVESDLVYYDAKLFLSGLVPYKDFITREPYLLYLTSTFLFFLKNYLNIFLNFYLIFSVLTIYFIYKIGYTISNKKFGVIAAFLYAFNPYILRYPSSDFQFYTNIYLCISVVIIFLLIQSLKYSRKKDYFLLGLSLGIGVWIYRGALPLIAIIPFLTSYILEEKLKFKEIIKNNLIIFYGLTISLLPPIVYYLPVVGYHWLDNMLSLNPLLILYFSFFPITCIVYFYKKYIIGKKNAFLQFTLLSLMLAIIFILFFYSNAVSTNPTERISVLNDFIRNIGYFLLPAIIIGSYSFVIKLFPDLIGLKKFIYIINSVILFLVVYGVDHIARGTSFQLSNISIVIFWILLASYSLFHFSFLKNVNESKAINEAFIFTIFIIFYLIMNLLFIEWIETYTINYIIPSLFLALLLFKNFFNNKKNILTFLFILLLMGIFTSFYYINHNFNINTQIKKTDLSLVLDYLKKNTIENEKIFTANPSFALRSNRNLALNITHPLIYITNPPFFNDYDPYHNVPTEKEINSYLKTNNIKIIIADQRTKSLFISDRHPITKLYIESNYYIDQTYGNIEIYRLKNN